MIIENYESNILDDIQSKLGDNVEMKVIEQKFLNGFIRLRKPKKILEVGVFRGGSSAIILNAIKDDKEAFLYSIDVNTHCYKDKSKLTGYLIKEQFPWLENKWKLFTGDLSIKFMEEIGGDIDFVFLDTVHYNPGELLDFLMILPFLKEKCILVIHDIIYHLYKSSHRNTSNNLLFSYVKGKKYMPNPEGDNILYNIGAIELDSDQKERYFDYFFALNSSWAYMLKDSDLEKIINFLRKYYEKYYVDLFIDAIRYNKLLLNKKGDKKLALRKEDL